MHSPIKYIILFGELTLANTSQAKKRVRQHEKRRQHNASQRSTMRTYLKRVQKVVVESKKEVALREHRLMSAMVDKLASKGLIHKNKAARHKSRLAARIKTLVV